MATCSITREDKMLNVIMYLIALWLTLVLNLTGSDLVVYEDYSIGPRYPDIVECGQ